MVTTVDIFSHDTILKHSSVSVRIYYNKISKSKYARKMKISVKSQKNKNWLN